MQALVLSDRTAASAAAQGREIYGLIQQLFPLPRCITGAGLRATVRRLGALIPLQVVEVPSGTQVFDWIVPDEWSIDEAYIEHESGRRFGNYRDSNLHLVGYSTPVDATMTLAELRPHLHSLPEHPDWIPYRTSFYTPNWGFCLTDRELQSLPNGRYHVVIRSQLSPGSLTLAECVVQGATDEEILVFAHDCHPSLANDNLSGIAVAAHLARFLLGQKTRFTYSIRFRAGDDWVHYVAREERIQARSHPPRLGPLFARRRRSASVQAFARRESRHRPRRRTRVDQGVSRIAAT